MYDPTETDLSFKGLVKIFEECAKKDIPACVIGGWASYLYVNPTYRRAFGQDYMGSRDIDIFFKPEKEKEFADVIKQLGYQKNGFPFRHERIYDRMHRKFVTQEQAKKEPIFNLIYIFLDLFSNKETKHLPTWSDLEPLKTVSFIKIKKFYVTDIDTLIALKCIALFARNKADKENKDACDLYALLLYGERQIKLTELLEKAVEKILARSDLIYSIAEHVLLDPNKQNIVEVSLKDKLKEIKDKLIGKIS